MTLDPIVRVHGSGTLAQTLMAHDLTDEYRLWIYPVVLENGTRLFREATTPAALKLIDTKTTSTGVVIHLYEPAGLPTYRVHPPQVGPIWSPSGLASSGNTVPLQR
jgi:dihydrofolate reductase